MKKPQAQLFGAHENSIWDLNWHPLGHAICTGCSDHSTRFWARNRPGDLYFKIIYFNICNLSNIVG